MRYKVCIPSVFVFYLLVYSCLFLFVRAPSFPQEACHMLTLQVRLGLPLQILTAAESIFIPVCFTVWGKRYRQLLKRNFPLEGARSSKTYLTSQCNVRKRYEGSIVTSSVFHSTLTSAGAWWSWCSCRDASLVCFFFGDIEGISNETE